MNYNTINDVGKGYYNTRGSKFYSFIHPIQIYSEHKHLISIYRSQYPESCHVCSSYRIFADNRLDEYSSDDGEPKGSSGTPILNQLKRNNLINVGVYVVRIFGGSLLGIPGLIQSYSTATLSAIDNIKHHRWTQSSTVLFSLSYEFEGIFKSLIKDFNAKIVSSTYLDEIEMLVSIDNISLVSFIDKTKNISSNKIKYNLTT
tara:strand:+ start:307 stop:912 length:606 start_codon:yes stop_codon:yes gene_type:complete